MSTEAKAPPKPISSLDVAWEEWSGIPRFGIRYRHLTLATIGEGYRVGVAIEELRPGKQSCPAHYHIFEEEHVYVLEGTLTARIGAETYEMKAGDYVCFPAGQKAGHCLIKANAIRTTSASTQTRTRWRSTPYARRTPFSTCQG
jgi:uncharacterized cupin superfamily protein